MRRARALAVVVAFASTGLAMAAPTAQDFLAMGMRQYEEGDFEAAVFSLDTAVRRWPESAPASSLVDAYVYLGAAYVGLGHEEAAKGKFRAALERDPARRLAPDAFPAKVIQVFETQVLKVTAARKRRSGTLALALGGVGAAAAVGAAVLTQGSEPIPNRPPEAGIHVTPTGHAIVGATVVTFNAVASDLDGDPLTFQWDLGDGARAAGTTITHVYAATGSFRVVLTAEDNRGGRAEAVASIVVGTLAGRWTTPGFTYNLTQRGSGVGGTVTNLALLYDVVGTVTGDRNVGWTAFQQQTGAPRYHFTGVADERLETLTGVHRDQNFGGQTFTVVLRRN